MLDLRLYGIVDPVVPRMDDLIRQVDAALAGGVTLLQLRAKDAATRPFFEAARALLPAAHARGVPVLVNDRVDVAHAIGADGVHLGQSDLPVTAARAILGPDAIIGLTVKSECHVADAPLDIIDYASVGGVFATSSKDNPDPPIGLDALTRLAALLRGRRADLAVCAIAGICEETAANVIAAGADGVSMISAVFGPADVEAAARRLLGIVDRALAARGPLAAGAPS